MAEINNIELGSRLANLRDAHGLSQAALARAIGAQQSQIANWEKGHIRPDPQRLRDLACALKVLPRTLVASAETRALMAHSFQSNPKPYRLGAKQVDSIYDIIGGPSEALNVSVQYHPEAIQLHGRIKSIYGALDRLAKDRAAENKSQYWDGPHTRLIQIGEETSSQLGNGHEQRGVVLHVGPASWYEYTNLNNFLDTPGILEDGETIREALADPNMIYSNPKDWSWCPLSNIMCASMTPITTDGFGIIQRRSASVSVGAGRLISGVSENIHRWLDEAPAHNLWQRVHPLVKRSEIPQSVGRNWPLAPGNVPSPYLAAQRGFVEELAWLRQVMEGSRDQFKFLGVAVDLEFFHPVIVGVIELPFNREEAQREIDTHRGKDHSEGLACQFVELSSSAPETLQLIDNPNDWVLCGLASLMMAARYWEFNKEYG